MSVAVTLKLIPALIEIEADGSACLVCGDAIYMKGYGVVVKTVDGKLGSSNVLDGALCGSCGPIIQEEWAEEDGDGEHQ